MNTIRMLPLLTLAFAACAAPAVGPWPTQGVIAPPSGGAAGYQHGPEHTLFVVGDPAKRIAQYGFLKNTGDQGVLATRLTNGSTFGVPSARAAALRLPPYGASSDEHDTFVKNYFLRLGLPAEQVGNVRGMTMLEARGSVGDASQSIPQITAYYSVLERTVDGVPVPDSFAWARVDSHGAVVAEAVYWPALSAEVLAQARRFRELLSDSGRREAFESRLPGARGKGSLAIRHSAATVDQPLEVFASFEVVSRSAPSAQNRAMTVSAAAVTRHFDLSGGERFLPQETLNLGTQYPANKPQAGPVR